MKICNYVLFLYLTNLFVLIIADRCCRISNRKSPNYKLLKTQSYSKEGVVSRKKVENVVECKKLAISKKALAFNYRDKLIENYRQKDRESEANCQVLECPEINFSHLVNDSRFSYYSSYRHLRGNTSVKCLPNVGVFYISEERKNYTNARNACKSLGGSLAHIASEDRTEGLGKLLKNIPTLIGLSNQDDGRIWKNEFDEPLSCFDYRAWATNEPIISRGCVGLVRPKDSRSSSSWRVLSCSRKSPYICEIFPRSQSHTRQNFDTT